MKMTEDQLRLQHLSTNALTISDQSTTNLSPVKLSTTSNLYNRNDDKEMTNDSAIYNHNLTGKCNRKDTVTGNNHNTNGKSLINNNKNATTLINMNPTNLTKQHNDKIEIAKDLRLTPKLHNNNTNNNNKNGNSNPTSFVPDNYSNNHMDNYSNNDKSNTNVNNCKEHNRSLTVTVTVSNDNEVVSSNATHVVQQSENTSDVNLKIPSKPSSRKTTRRNTRTTDIAHQNAAAAIVNNSLLVKSDVENSRAPLSPDKNKCYEEVISLFKIMQFMLKLF